VCCSSPGITSDRGNVQLWESLLLLLLLLLLLSRLLLLRLQVLLSMSVMVMGFLAVVRMCVLGRGGGC
jgi:hypothetical protein